MAKYTVLELDGKFYVATSDKKKYWPNTGTSKAEAETEVEFRTALYNIAKLECFPKLDLDDAEDACNL